MDRVLEWMIIVHPLVVEWAAPRFCEAFKYRYGKIIPGLCKSMARTYIFDFNRKKPSVNSIATGRYWHTLIEQHLLFFFYCRLYSAVSSANEADPVYWHAGSIFNHEICVRSVVASLLNIMVIKLNLNFVLLGSHQKWNILMFGGGWLDYHF